MTIPSPETPAQKEQEGGRLMGCNGNTASGKSDGPPSTSPCRIQRKRSKGWRMPAGAVYVGRPTKWGNPFPVHRFGFTGAVEYFRTFCAGEFDNSMPDSAKALYRQAESKLYGPVPASLTLGELARVFLRGKDLACWCPLDQARSALMAYMRKRQGDQANAQSVVGQARKQIASANELLMHLPPESPAVTNAEPQPVADFAVDPHAQGQD